MIVKIEASPLKYKRYQITMDSGKKISFGLKDGSTYIDHHDKVLRNAYRARHYANATEKQLIDNLVPSPSLLSYYILWGPNTDIYENIKYLNGLWAAKHR